MVPIGLVYSIHDPTEVAIQKMIDASQRMTKNKQFSRRRARNTNHPATKGDFELEIEMLQNAP
jgi:hypothetical protein